MLKKTINGFDMHYVEAGIGEPVVLVHGSFSDYRYWSPQRDVFASAYRVITPSLRPYWPNGQQTPEGSFDVPRYVSDMGAFIEALDVGPVHLCGHSMGGHVALRVALSYPSLVRTLVLAEPGGPLAPDLMPNLDPSAGSVVANAMKSAADLIRSGDPEAGLRLLTASATRPGGWEAAPDFYRQMALANATTLIAQIVERRPAITLADVERLEQPVLLIGGRDTGQPFPMILDALEAHLPHAARVDIPGGTHLMSIENPSAFNAAVLAFWDSQTKLNRDAA